MVFIQKGIQQKAWGVRLRHEVRAIYVAFLFAKIFRLTMDCVKIDVQYSFFTVHIYIQLMMHSFYLPKCFHWIRETERYNYEVVLVRSAHEFGSSVNSKLQFGSVECHINRKASKRSWNSIRLLIPNIYMQGIRGLISCRKV